MARILLQWHATTRCDEELVITRASEWCGLGSGVKISMIRQRNDLH